MYSISCGFCRLYIILSTPLIRKHIQRADMAQRIMDFARPPKDLSSEGSMDVNWRDWRQQFITFLKASGGGDWPTDRKASLLINFIGPVGQKISQNFSSEDCEDMEKLIEKFDHHFGLNVTETHERYVFFSSVKQNTDTIDQYVNTLKARAKSCKFGDLMDSLIRDKIVLDVKDKKLRKLLLGEPNLSLDETIDIWKTYESTAKLIQFSLDTIIKPQLNNLDICSAKIDSSSCKRCGTLHHPKNCPAWGQKCENCGMLNHLAKSCTKPSISNTNSQNELAVPKYFNPGPFAQIPGSTKTRVYQ